MIKSKINKRLIDKRKMQIKKRRNAHTFVKRSKNMEELHKKQKLYLAEESAPYNLPINCQELKSIDLNEGSHVYDQLVSKCATKGHMDMDKQCNDENIKQNDMENYKTTQQTDVEKLQQKNSKIFYISSKAFGGDIKLEIPEYAGNNLLSVNDFQGIELDSVLLKNIKIPLTLQEEELLTIFNEYRDVYLPQRNFNNSENLRLAYSFHALSHLLKSREIILRNNKKLAKTAKNDGLLQNDVSIPDKFRDQGLQRLKILMIVPFRDSAFKIINILCQLLYGENTESRKKDGTIMNYKRFIDQFTGNKLYMPQTSPKPLDYQQLFTGNIDDNFKIGIRLTKKTLTLFSDFDSSDILIASPLALRMLIGSSKSTNLDTDFLNSIEILIIDQAEVLLAQNWENLLYVLDHFHLQPKNFPKTNCQRVRTWCLSGLSQFYRQTILLSSFELPEFRAVLNNKCHNYEGKIQIQNNINCGSIQNLMVPIKQTFKRVNCSDIITAIDERFQYFVNEILPLYTLPNYAHSMIYVPSYLDFVRIRNYLKGKSISFAQINEYTKNDKIARARDLFFHSGVQFLLYSERSHFFRRTRIKGIRHLVIYQPPNYPNFYSELVNLMVDSNQNRHDSLENAMSITVIYSKYDALSLTNILGTSKALNLLKSRKKIHEFTAE